MEASLCFMAEARPVRAARHSASDDPTETRAERLQLFPGSNKQYLDICTLPHTEF